MGEEYKSVISSRPAFNREHHGSFSNLSMAGPRVLKMVSEFHQSGAVTPSGMGGGSCSQQIRDKREQEKLEMRHLNDRLASFIEKVRFLDAQNRKLTSELDHIQKCLEKSSVVEKLFVTEVNGAKEVIENATWHNDEAELELNKLKDELESLKKKLNEAQEERSADRTKIDDLLIELSNLEAEINLLKRRIALLEEENDRQKKENLRLNTTLQTTRSSVDQQSLLSLQLRNECTSLIEEVQFVKNTQEQELRDLLALAARDTTGENREYFKNELSNAMKEIRNEYDLMNASLRQEMETTYSMRIQEVETQAAKQNVEQGHQKEETRKLKSQIVDLRSRLAELGGRNAQLEKQIEECSLQMEDDQRAYEADLNEQDRKIRNERESIQALMIEYQMMMDKKQTLDAELAIYRKMLEGEEQDTGLKQLVEQVVRTTGINEAIDTETMRVVKGETSSRSSHEKSAKGNVVIKETCPNAHFIILENTHKSKDEIIGCWKIKRQIDGKDVVVFTFPEEFVLPASATVKICANGHGEEQLPDVLVFEEKDSFGLGNNIKTFIYNKEGEERASYIQRELASQTTE